MIYSAIFHRPMSEYAHAYDETHYIFRVRTAPNDIQNCLFYFADRAAMTPNLSFSFLPMKKERSDKYYDYYEVLLETNLQRIAYYFELDDGNEKIYYFGDCFSNTPIAERSEYFQLPFNLRADRVVIPKWVKDAVVYNIFPDSFANGKRKMIPQKQSTEYNKEECKSLLGGTINGIRENLDYIQNLGCNCIYLNPFFAAQSYHKYDLLDYFHVDPTRGTDEDFRLLVNKAHEKNMHVIIDGVFNHVSWRHHFFKDVMEKGKGSKYYDFFYDLPERPVFPENGKEPEYMCFAYVPEMPKTNTADDRLRKYFCDVGAYWIKEFDVDGWRLDVANELDDRFLRTFRDTVKSVKEDVLVIGEVWENANHYINANMMDGAMNYDFRRFCRQFFAERKIDASQFDARVTNMLVRYKKQALYAQLNLLDSHDVSRFMSVCNNDRNRYEMALLFQMAFIGMPCVFYGDEKGLCGESEKEYRRPMDFEKKDNLEEIYKKFIKLRQKYSCLREGKFETILAKGGFYGFKRYNDKEEISIFINNSKSDLFIEVNGEILFKKNYTEKIIRENGYIIVLGGKCQLLFMN